MHEHADSALLIEAYYKITTVVDEFRAALPSDLERQLSLQGKLLTAVLANFLQNTPGLTEEGARYIFNFALATAQQTYVPAELVN